MVQSLLDILLPRRCVGCGRAGAWICAACRAGIHRMAAPLCELCGREVGAGKRCQDCARDQPSIDGVRAATRYEGVIRTAVHRLKYNGQRAIAAELARFLAEAVREAAFDVDVIVPLPLHPNRLRARGYNQSALLASELGRQLGLPVEPLAARTRDTEDQIGKNRKQRQENVRGAFTCAVPGAVAGRRVAIVDDVCTTGSTLFACAAPLQAAGAAKVWGLAVARQDNGRT